MILKEQTDAESGKVSSFYQTKWISYSLFNIRTNEVTADIRIKARHEQFERRLVSKEARRDKSYKKNSCS